MGLQDLLKTKGSKWTKHDGATPPTNPLATSTSGLHAQPSGQAGYSLAGGGATAVKKAYNEYEDGVNNPIPQPSKLDLNGQRPKTYINPETGQSYP